ncbi:hypothetical protein SAMN05216170_1440 [Thermococcus thioreducens]|uniref:Uncharacterized protein n=1 Tax=Thermococcus thioreducens TaxID=277988 RepID=A0A1I0P1Y2_9EURY|nr:hypothetical protein SAMN05216170_1440 [Thermococcus thioreducens]
MGIVDSIFFVFPLVALIISFYWRTLKKLKNLEERWCT